MDKNKEELVYYIKSCYEEGPKHARDNIFKYGNELQKRSVYSNLKTHIDDFLSGKLENRFVVMPGLRGVGKTTLLFQLYDYLLKKGINKNQILYLAGDDLNQLIGDNVRNTVETFVSEIHEKSLVSLDKKLFVFVDESQEIDGWSKQGKVIYDLSKNIFMIFTGSVALDFELDVNAVRRTKKDLVFPLSFREQLSLKYNLNSFLDIESSLKNTILTGNMGDITKKEKNLLDSLPELNISLDKEWEHYLCYGGFPDSIYLNEFDSHMRIYDMVERVVEKDVYHYLSYNNGTKAKIFQILKFLALQKPGQLSNDNLANNVGISSSRVNALLGFLEKTHLIFHVNPYGGASKIVRKAWKYYFLSPSINASINSKIGKYSPFSSDYLGILSENLVASTFFKMNIVYGQPYGIFYIHEKNHADFVLTNFDGETVPVEVGFGKKSKRQVIRSMNKYGSEYGIIISNTTPFIRKEDDIIYIPLITFSFLI